MNNCPVCYWLCLLGLLGAMPDLDRPLAAKEAVGTVSPAHPRSLGSSTRYLVPTGQLLTPAGRQIELPGMRPQAIALSPDGQIFVSAGKTNALIILEAATGNIRQSLPLTFTNQIEIKTNPPAASVSGQPAKVTLTTNISLAHAQLSLTGLIFSPDGKRIYLANTAGNVWIFTVDRNHRVSFLTTFAVPDAMAPKHKREIPAGLAMSDDGLRLYVVGNLGNRLHELEAQTGRVMASWDTGVAPCDVALAAGKAYVSNLGGRRPGPSDLTAPAALGTTVRVDPVRHIASEGSVTVIDLITGRVKTEILVGLHASALAVSPNRKYVVVANTGSDTLSVIDTQTDLVIEKIWTRQTPADLFGAQPNALAFDPNGRRLYVCNGTQNAVAVIEFEPEKNASRVIGLIPVGWFPGAIAFDARRNRLCIANIKGYGAMKAFPLGQPVKLSSKDFFGTISLLAKPSKTKLAAMTRQALHNLRYPKLQEALLPPRPDQPARPVPERTGEPSLFKHVIYIIKENRTYDQVLGDMKEGNGDPQLCVFGEKFTPNQHQVAREFVLLDNTFCSGVQSADGHQWTDSAIANDYLERQLTSGFPRSYAGGKSETSIDALAWASSGFIWDNALAHGKTFRNYGEWMISEAGWRNPKGHKEKPQWQDFWNDYKTGSNLTRLASWPGIETLRKHSLTNTVGWDLNVPDVMRAAEFIKELRQFETNGGFPNLMIVFLPNDHTGGTRGKSPTPGAQIADNDLAFGQIVEAISHSQFWPATCLFAIEDDPQAGWDHVSGYRTTCFVVSPYTKRQQTISTPYNQVSLVRTIELILGLPPMNQLCATATPMGDCFTDQADLTPYTCQTNQVALDQFNPEPKKIADPQLRQDALVSASLPLDEVDRCPEDVLNRILWRAMKGSQAPYPEWAVKAMEDDD